MSDKNDNQKKDGIKKINYIEIKEIKYEFGRQEIPDDVSIYEIYTEDELDNNEDNASYDNYDE